MGVDVYAHLLGVESDDSNIPGLNIFAQHLSDVREDLVYFNGVVPRGRI